MGDLLNGTGYAFVVRAVTAGGVSAPSAPSAAARPTGVPDAPMAVAAVAGDGCVTLDWQAPASDGGVPVRTYHVVAVSGLAPPMDVDGGRTHCVVKPLPNGHAIAFRVIAGGWVWVWVWVCVGVCVGVWRNVCVCVCRCLCVCVGVGGWVCGGGGR